MGLRGGHVLAFPVSRSPLNGSSCAASAAGRRAVKLAPGRVRQAPLDAVDPLGPFLEPDQIRSPADQRAAPLSVRPVTV